MSQEICQGYDRGIDAVKGFLILLIVCGHMKVLKENALSFVDAIYLFHVVCFLLLPFLQKPLSFSKETITRYSARLLYPFVIFYALYTLMAQVALGMTESLSVTLWKFGQGLVFASSSYFDEITQLKMLWFLPALFVLLSIRSFLADKKKVLVVFIVACALCHVTISHFGEWLYNVPWGLPIVMFVFPLGLMIPRVMAWGKSGRLKYAVLAVFAALFATAFVKPHHVDIGDMDFAALKDMRVLFLMDALILTATASLVLFKDALAKVPFLTVCGRHSLPLYLVHLPVLEVAWRSPLAQMPWPLHVGLLLVVSVGIVFVCEFVATKWPRLYRFGFPKTVEDLRVFGGKAEA